MHGLDPEALPEFFYSFHMSVFYPLPGRKVFDGRLDHIKSTFVKTTRSHSWLTQTTNTSYRIRSSTTFLFSLGYSIIRKLYVLDAGTVRNTRRRYTSISHNEPTCVHGLELLATHHGHLKNRVRFEFIPNFISVNQILFHEPDLIGFGTVFWSPFPFKAMSQPWSSRGVGYSAARQKCPPLSCNRRSRSVTVLTLNN